MQEVTGSSPVPSTTKILRHSSGDFLFGGGTGLEQQRRRPPPAAETGSRGWGRVLIFQSPAKGLRKNQNATRTGASRQIPSRFPTPRNVYQERCRQTHSSRVFLFWWTVQDENRNKQRQGITMSAVSCLLPFSIEYGILGSVQQICIWRIESCGMN